MQLKNRTEFLEDGENVGEVAFNGEAMGELAHGLGPVVGDANGDRGRKLAAHWYGFLPMPRASLRVFLSVILWGVDHGNGVRRSTFLSTSVGYDKVVLGPLHANVVRVAARGIGSKRANLTYLSAVDLKSIFI